MKHKLKTITVLAFMAITIFSCSKDDSDSGNANTQNSITVSVTNGASYSSQIDQAVLYYYKSNPGTSTDELTTLKTVSYNSGHFSFELPSYVATSSEDVIDLAYKPETNEQVLENTFKSSDANARIVIGYIGAYKSGSHIGDFHLGYTSGNTTVDGEYIYADRDVSITGKISVKNTISNEVMNGTYAMNLKKGWNLLYLTSVETGDFGGNYTYSSTAPTVALSWLYAPYNLTGTAARGQLKIKATSLNIN